MQLKKLLEKWDLTSLKITTPFLEMHWEPKDEDKTAAWDLYVELITRAAIARRCSAGRMTSVSSTCRRKPPLSGQASCFI